MALNFTAADRVGGIGGYIGGIATLLGMANGGVINPNNGSCEGDHVVNRYEAGQSAEIAALKADIKLRDANTYADQKDLAMYQYVDNRMRNIESQLCDQRVYNATNNATINCIANQVNQLLGMTKIVIPNSSVCPGWGEAKVTVQPATAATGG